MNILYAIQGTGNGHLSRASDVGPALEKHGKVDYFISGAQADIGLSVPIQYKSPGLSFYFGKRGGVDFLQTYRKNSSKRIYKEIKDFPVDKYDLVINDFEPITAWASKLKGKKCIALSHQSALLSDICPKPKSSDLIGQTILKKYAPASEHYGFHFSAFDQNIYTPVVRKAIRELEVSDLDHYTVYLPAYSDEKLISKLSQVKDVKWQVFSKHAKECYEFKNVRIHPIDNEKFMESFSSCHGVLCGAGFEMPSEALFLGKKLMVIPMKNQYEQQCNAAALRELGVSMMKKLGDNSVKKIKKWILEGEAIKVDYPDETQEIVDLIVKRAKV
ncbi:MAG: glycosyltransferase family protein [Bacteroidota bacterium]